MDSLQVRESSLPNLPLSPEAIATWTAEPFRQLPAEFRIPTWEFWAFWSQQLQHGQLALATRIRQWIADGMTLADLKAAFVRLNNPSEAAQHDHGGKVLAALSEHVASVMRDRHRAEYARCREGTSVNRREITRILGRPL